MESTPDKEQHRTWWRGLTRSLAIAAVFGLVATLNPLASADLSAVPVRCAAGDITLDGRVFPEPRLSATFLTFDDYLCGITFLAGTYDDQIEVVELGKSASGLPIHDVRVTNESIPEADKKHLFILNSIHGNEPAGREGGARVIEDMVTPSLLGEEEFVVETLDRFVVHFVFGNPDGWVNGDFLNGGGLQHTRANDGGRDLNRNFPVQGFLRTANGTLDQPEGRAIDALFQEYADTEHPIDHPENNGWYLGTDNHGQSAKPVAASGLQIVGQFDYQKSERLAHFADGIEGAMAEYGVLDVLQELNGLTGGQVRPYEWGTLYDILGYSASGSGIDYYNTPGVIEGTGFATEMTASNAPYNFALHPALLNQMWVDSVRAINYTMMRDAIAPPSFEYEVGGNAGYVFDPDRVTHGDSNGFGAGNAEIPSNFTGDDPGVEPNFQFRPYNVTRMKFFEDLNEYATSELDKLTVDDVLTDPTVLASYDSVVLTDNPMPGNGDRAQWAEALTGWIEDGGNLIVTDGAAPLIADLVEGIEATDITMARSDVGYVDFGDRSHPLNANLRGVASQTYDVIPIGYPDNAGQAPNWRVASSAWSAAGGYTAGTTGTDQTSYGSLPLGEGRISFLGALLPQPTEEYFHPYGLQNYAVTYTGYTLLQNMLDWTDPSSVTS
jgi:hypothetical protein